MGALVGLQTADYNEDFDWDRPFESGVVAVTGGACIPWALVMGAAFVVTFASIALEVRSRDLDLRGKWSIFVSWNSDVGFSDEFLLSIGVMTHDDPIHATRMRGILENITQQWLHRDMAVAFVSWRDNAERQKRARRLDINELTSEAKQTAATGSGSVDVRGPDVLAISSSALVFTSESLPLNNHGDPAGPVADDPKLNRKPKTAALLPPPPDLTSDRSEDSKRGQGATQTGVFGLVFKNPWVADNAHGRG